MKKILSLFTLSVMILLTASVSAITVCNTENTVIGGTVYQDVITNPIGGANVEVICHHLGSDYTLSGLTLANGKYSIVFPAGECDYGDSVTVNANKNALTGTNDGSVSMTYTLPCQVTVNVGVVNVPLVPEFGLIAGLTTALGALGVFFLVRRK
jgi:hypothetical protein